MTKLRLLLGAFLILPSPVLQAHLLKVFAAAEGPHIQGSVYFAGGAKAVGAQVSVRAADGRILAQLIPDTQGAFSYQASVRMDHVILADSGDGHVAQWTVRAEELPSALPNPDSSQALPLVPELAEQGSAHDHTHAEAHSPMPLVPELADARIPPDGGLVALVEEAVARQVRPLREQLLAYEERVRLHEILGGIGYILGLAGLILWWRTRQP